MCIAMTQKESEKAKSHAPKEGKISVSSIRLEPSENVSTYYVNHIEVGNSVHDFSLICGRLPGKLNMEQLEEIKSTGTFTLEPDVMVVIPASLISGLIRALTTQKETYEKAYGVELKELRNAS